MFKNYLKIAFRNLWKHKAFSFINILGLTVGMSACFLIFLYVQFELNYDHFHPTADRVYRVIADIKTPTETMKAGGPAWAVAPNLKTEFPEVEAYTLFNKSDLLISKGDAKIQEDNASFADSSFFKVFGMPLLKGNAAIALSAPYSLVLTESTAKKYFGNEEALGQTLYLWKEKTPAKVTGIIRDMPENTILKADLLLSMSTLTQKLAPKLDQQWGNYGSLAFLLLKPGVNVSGLQAKFPAFLERKNGDEMKQLQMYPTLILEQLKRVYLYSDRGEGSIRNVYIFSIIALFILLIACINFVNLTTARSTERAREVGIRKVVGAARFQLMRQFIGESILICLISFLLTIGLSMLLLPLFNQLAGKTVSEGIFSQPRYLLLLLGAAIGIGMLAGSYPALVLSSFKPISVLKGRFTTGLKGILLRKGLVIGQFTISTALIIGTIVVYRQMNYMRTRDLGFAKDQVLILDHFNDPSRDALQQAITSINGVRSTAQSGSVPGTGNPGAYSEIENNHGDLQIANLDLYFVDFDFIPFYNMKMAAGRPFSRAFGTDSTQAMVINEKTAKLLGYTSAEAAVGRRFKQWGREGKIVGVVKDFHFRGLQEEIKPLTMRIEPGSFDLISVKVDAAKVPMVLKAVEQKWKSLLPYRPFSYTFLDEVFDKQYRTEERFGNLFMNFAILAIFISCLGLLGLAAYSTTQRTKEIGIRKVLGASVGGIVNLLSKDFLKLVLISFLIASPIAWYFMHQWLQGFAYRSAVSWWIFLLAGVLALVIALATISFQAIKAAIMNPVKSLKSE